MDQITVSDIPLPGEEVCKNTDDSAKQTDEVSLPKPETAEQHADHTEIKVETTGNTTESDNTTIKSENAIETAAEVKESTVTVNEAEKLAEELIQEVTEGDAEQVECITSDVITETVEELQMEVEEAISADSVGSVESDISTVILERTQEEVDESMETLRCDDSVEQMKEVEQQNLEEVEQQNIEEVEQQNVEEVQQHTVEEVEQIEVKKEVSPIVEEPPTSAIQQEITIENKIENIEKPAKKFSRTNSTIEAIKNDWLTIEEVSDEVESSSPKPEPIITEPDTKTDNNIEKNDVEVEKTPATNETIEIAEEKSMTMETIPTEEVGEVVVIETVHDEIIGTVAENVTIEIIDNSAINNEITLETVEEKTEAKSQKPAEEKQEVVIVVEDKKIEEIKKSEKAHEPKPRGRPPSKANVQRSDNLQIPCHVLGRNVDNPTEDLISNGRTPPKPRLGVKVPYRFLTSQIVTKEEIAHELLELTDKRNPTPDPPAGGDIFFASKLTQRLASKIALNAIKKKEPDTATATAAVPESTSGIPNDALTSSATTSTSTSTSTTAAAGAHKTEKSIGDNSDLLAILEGDVDVDWTKDIRNTKTSEAAAAAADVKQPIAANATMKTPADVDVSTANSRKLDPATERQLALKQLREMPKKEGRGRPRKHFYDMRPQRIIKVESTPSPPVPVPVRTPADVQQKSPPETKPPVITVSNETNENIKQAVNKLASKIKENVTNTNVDKSEDVESDLSLTPRRVTKTYSRKETVVDIPDDLQFIVNETESSSCALIDSKPSETKRTTEKEKKVEENKPATKKTKRSLPETVNTPEITLVSKRARIIKKKVIWDPAEVPKTRVLNAIRRAQQLEMKARKQKMKQKEAQTSDDEDDEDEDDTEEDNKPLKQEQKESKTQRDKVQQQQQHIQQKLRKRQVTKQEVKRPLRKLVQRPPLSKIQKKKLLISRPLRFVRSSNGELKSSLALSKKKKQMMTEIAKSVQNKPKKTELDRLLGDEGAVNMLYSVKQRGRPTKKTIITQRELQNRTKVLRETITQISSQDDTTKALRKKESPQLPAAVTAAAALQQLPVRKKSRDSVRSSLQSPPPSPSFFHPQRAEASRIIRRHSSSFSSDCSSPRRLSIDNNKETADDAAAKNGDFQSPSRVLRRKDVKPDEKIVKKTEKPEKVEKEKLTSAEKRKLNSEMSKNFDKMPKKRTRSSKGDREEETKPEVEETKPKGRSATVQTDYKELVLKKSNHFYQIIMNTPTNSKLRDVISLQMFHELTAAITKLSKDENCKILCLTSKGKSFCNGLDFSHLIQSTAEKRSSAALDMSRAMKEFILSLARFPKPFLCCLSSSSSFLGVTMLPYFDMVVAADTAMLSADYSRLGHSPEGAPQLTMTSTAARDLLLLGRKFSAKEAVDLGLVTLVDAQDKLEERLVKVADEFEGKSQQSLAATKSLLRQPLLQKLEEALDFEQKLLVELWPTVECQQHFKKLLTEQELW